VLLTSYLLTSLYYTTGMTQFRVFIYDSNVSQSVRLC